jgi:hypothetical protein
VATFQIKRNDLLPEIVATCLDADGAPVDLTGATGVEFHMKAAEAGSPKVDAAGTIVDAATGVVKYSWTGSDTDTAGTYSAEFEVMFTGSKQMTFPNFENITITITEDLS